MTFKMLLLGAGIVALGVSNAAAVGTTTVVPKPVVASVVETATCRGYNRNYRDFNHCMQVGGQANLAYCSRICSSR
jgi:hypothetical protein